MPQEPITFRAQDGTTAQGVAEIVRYGSGIRTTKATLFALGGFVAGAACIIMPVLHLVTTWAFPLVGIILCRRALRTHDKLIKASGACPACGKPIDLYGGPLTDPPPRACPACNAALEINAVGDAPSDNSSLERDAAE